LRFCVSPAKSAGVTFLGNSVRRSSPPAPKDGLRIENDVFSRSHGATRAKFLIPCRRTVGVLPRGRRCVRGCVLMREHSAAGQVRTKSNRASSTKLDMDAVAGLNRKQIPLLAPSLKNKYTYYPLTREILAHGGRVFYAHAGIRDRR
jgi:hypothetical protein